MVRVLKAVSQGYVRISEAIPDNNSNRSIKINGPTFKKLVNNNDREKLIARAITLMDNGNHNGFDIIVNMNRANQDLSPSIKSGLQKTIKEYLNQTSKFLMKINSTYTQRVRNRNKKIETTKIFPLNQENVEKIANSLGHRAASTEILGVLMMGVNGDEYEYNEYEDMNISSIELEKMPDLKVLDTSGAMCKFINSCKALDLNDIQIVWSNPSYYEGGSEEQYHILNEHCLIYALRKCGVQEKYLDIIKTYFNSTHFPKNKVKTLPDIIKRDIKFYKTKFRIEETSKKQEKTFTIYKTNDKQYDEISLCLIDEHYMIYKYFPYTQCALTNINEFIKYKQTKNGVPWFKCNEKYANGKPKFKSAIDIPVNRVTNTIKLYKILKENKQVFIENTIEVDSNTKVYDYYNLDNIIEDQKEFEHIEKIINEEPIAVEDKKIIKGVKYYAGDLECITTAGLHIPIIVGYKTINGSENDVRQFFYRGEDNNYCIQNMFQDIVRRTDTKLYNIIVYFHNLKYDFHAMLKNINVTSSIIKDNQYYSVKISVFVDGKIHHIEIRDSYKLLAIPLCEFQEQLDLPKNLNKKEAIAYDYYTLKNVKKGYRTSIKSYAKKLQTEEDRQILYTTLENNKLIFEVNDKTFNSMKYYAYYHKYDVLILAIGLNKMRQDLLKSKDMDLFHSLTISSFSTKYLQSQGGYDDICGCKGMFREFLSRGIYGGVVRTNEQYTKKIINEDIEDFDAVSLYPSAMIRINQKYGGLPTGEARKIKQFDINQYNFYFVEINITKINKKQQMPFIPTRIDGILQYINELPKDIPLKLHLFSFDLEDLIEFHEIEYDFIQGVYWENGNVNSGFGDVVEQLIADRNVYKSKKQQSLQLICKLMANSLYGSSIMKKSFENIKYIKQEDLNKFCSKNYNLISKIENINDRQYRVVLNTIEKNSYNYNHIGGFILSMSKRIMREVMNSANENNIPIYYQDTDSMHIRKQDIQKLSEKYLNIYKRELIGKNVGQFHGDFSFNNAHSIISKKSIFIGKKIYIDFLEAIAVTDGPDYQLQKNGPWLPFKKDEKVYNYHCRWKGVNLVALMNGRNDGETLMDVYERTINGEEIIFCLNPENAKPKFHYTPNGVALRLTGDFTRTNFKKKKTN